MKSFFYAFLFLSLLAVGCANLVGRSKSKLSLVVCDFQSSVSDVSKMVQENHRSYAERHGYSYAHGDASMSDGRAPNWSKINLMKRSLLKFEWVMWLDGDAVIINKTRSIEWLFDTFKVMEPFDPEAVAEIGGVKAPVFPSLVFSGDTNAINTGVVIMRRSKWSFHVLNEIWKIGEALEKNGQIGMGLDNGSFSIFLGGCTSNSTHAEMIACYEKVDIGFSKQGEVPAISSKIRAAELDVYRKMLSPELLRHVHPVPQVHFNEYDGGRAKFIIHLAGQYNKEETLRGILDSLKNRIDS